MTASNMAASTSGRTTVSVPSETQRRDHGGQEWIGPIDVALGRLAGAGLLVWMGWIHLHLWNIGYKHVHVIGTLFLLNFIGGVVLALAVLAVPFRLLALASGAGTLLFAGTLVGLAISINYGLFGFQDSFGAPFAHLSVWVESAGAVVLAALTARSLLTLRSRQGRGR